MAYTYCHLNANFYWTSHNTTWTAFAENGTATGFRRISLPAYIIPQFGLEVAVWYPCLWRLFFQQSLLEILKKGISAKCFVSNSEQTLLLPYTAA